MSTSYTLSDTSTGTGTFTLTHAKYLASKVRTDLMRMNRFYGRPTLSDVDQYDLEITSFLHAGYLKEVTYGFMRNNKWIQPSLRYTPQELLAANDDRPGRVDQNMDVSGAVFHSYLSYSDKWWALSDVQKETFKKTLPFSRTAGTAPGVVGYFENDKTYGAGGIALGRSSVRS